MIALNIDIKRREDKLPENIREIVFRAAAKAIESFELDGFKKDEFEATMAYVGGE